MPHPRECTQWEYKDSPAIGVLEGCCINIASKLREDEEFRNGCLADTRPTHHEMFHQLVPDEWHYLAGNYRGANFYCLVERPVVIYGQYGTLPIAVAGAMDYFHSQLKDDLALLEEAKTGAAPISQTEFDAMVVELLVNSMVLFLGYHPYANGNGHIGRMLLWAGLARYGLWPRRWSLNSRPNWDTLIKQHREGRPKPLFQFVLKALK